LSVMFVLPLLMTVALGFTATLSSTAVVNRLREIEPFGSTFAALGTLMPYLVVIGLFSFLYVFVPNIRVRFRPAVLGGLFAGVLWAGSGKLFATFVVGASRTEQIYAGFAILFVAIFWIYLSWLILLLGAQLAFYVQNPDYLRLGQRTESTSNALRERLALSVMLLVGRDFERPGHGWRVESLASRIRVPRHLLEPVVTALASAGLLTRTTEQRLIPARDPRRIAVAELVDAVRNTDRDAVATPSADWNPTVRGLTESIEQAIRGALGNKTLADIVDADVAADSAQSPQPAQSAPRSIGRR
jgi:membrane protein